MNQRTIQENVGTELKFNVSITPMNDVHMDDYDFECTFYPYVRSGKVNHKKSVVVTKAEMIRVDADNYIACVDTTVIGAGEIMLRVAAHLPDEEMPGDGLRTEIVSLSTGTKIY